MVDDLVRGFFSKPIYGLCCERNVTWQYDLPAYVHRAVDVGQNCYSFGVVSVLRAIKNQKPSTFGVRRSSKFRAFSNVMNMYRNFIVRRYVDGLEVAS